MIRSLLIVLAMLVGTITCAQEGLPKFVQNLSAAEYATWAAWQNRQAKLRATEESENSDEEQYIYAIRTTSSASGGVTAGLNRLNKTNWSRRGGTTRATATNNVATWRNAEVETMPQRYSNPAYKPPGSVTFHNPYARFVKNRGTPNWNKLFVPCKTGTMTVAEALDNINGPVPAEEVFNVLMSAWLTRTLTDR
jgi:hypothetical protein